MLIALYLSAIVLANVSVAIWGAEVSILNAFLLIGLDLTTRDMLHEKWHNKGLFWKMALLIGSGSILSAMLNYQAIPIALASFLAFAGAGLTDTMIYKLLQDKSRFLKINGSNVFSAGVDSLIFPIVAFGYPVLWFIVLGQFVAKVAGGFLWSIILVRYYAGYN